MKHNNVHLIYFSPTGTTRKIINAVAEGLNPEQVNCYDLTYPIEKTEQNIVDGIAVIGVPVYAGRVPKDCLERMAYYKAHNVPTVLIALYGNREFEDALVELRDIAITQGFNVIAAGAFIGEHSYSTPERPIAAGRPNGEDLSLAVKFGQEIAAKIELNDFNTPEIDGNVPYKERVKFGGVAPETDADICILCGRCAEVCPVRVITVSNAVTTQAENCIMCSACVKICPVEARPFNHPVIKERRELLIKNCSTAKRPKIFL
ncbi:MAG: 4Fe-4S binding protein [Desulfuromusa sp.]|jgi:ferredoxin/flavodoxin|nr:4Fe-4S binding protein [Desulfuromusa sp.]